MLIPVVAASLFAMLLAWLVPRWDARLAWCLGIALVLLAAFRGGGHDYQNYLDLIAIVRGTAEEDLLARYLITQDPLLVPIIDIAGWFTDDPVAVFALVALVGLLPKVLASSALPRYRTAFIGLYALMLAPGLEFAAIRASMAIGFLLLWIASSSRYRIIWLAFGVLSHVSALVVPLGRYVVRHRALSLFGLGATTVLAATAGLPFLEETRLVVYIDSPGTVFALFWPLVTLAAWLPLRSRILRTAPPGAFLDPVAVGCTTFCLAIALILTLPIVQPAFRVLEIAWVLIVAQLVALVAADRRSLGTAGVAFAAVLLLATLLLSNVIRETWALMLPGAA